MHYLFVFVYQITSAHTTTPGGGGAAAAAAVAAVAAEEEEEEEEEGTRQYDIKTSKGETQGKACMYC